MAAHPRDDLIGREHEIAVGRARLEALRGGAAGVVVVEGEAGIGKTTLGDVAVIYWEADDVEAALKGMATSRDPFDQWFRDHVRNVHGINVEDGFPPPEQVVDLRTA